MKAIGTPTDNFSFRARQDCSSRGGEAESLVKLGRVSARRGIRGQVRSEWPERPFLVVLDSR